jgi:hypothetical protein
VEPPPKITEPKKNWGYFRCNDAFNITLQALEKDMHYFKIWLHDNQIYPLTNSTAAGPNFFSASFPIEFKDKIIAYLEKNGLPKHDG